MQTCIACKRELEYLAFGVDNTTNGLNGRCRKCKECKNAYNRQQWHKKTKFNPRVRERMRRYDKPYNKAYKLKSVYGITMEEFELMQDIQQYACAICATPMDDRRPVVDHNHATGSVRGLLCQQCNALLGMAGDCPATLESAMRYLRNDGVMSGRGQV